MTAMRYGEKIRSSSPLARSRSSKAANASGLIGEPARTMA